MFTTDQYQKKLQHIINDQDLLRIDDNGQSALLPPRVPNQGEYVIIDAVNFVCSINTFTTPQMKDLGVTMTTLLSCDLDELQSSDLDEMFLQSLQSSIIHLFGNEFSNIQAKIGGLHGYTKSLIVKSAEGDILLNIAYGGSNQNNTVFFGLTGVGCKLANPFWEKRLHDFLSTAIDSKISRIDLAHDDFYGLYSSFDWANEKESQNAFMLPKTRNRPACRIAGEFKHGDPQNKGLTLYVGNRQNGKIIRCYEKGKQLGCPTSLWFRSELEIHNKKRLIPFDVLLNPTDYFCGSYPYCLELVELAKKYGGDTTPQHSQAMPSVKNESKISLFRMISIFKNQFGKHLKTFGELFIKDGETDYYKIFDMLKTDKKDDYYPKRLRLPKTFFVRKDKLNSIVEFEKEFLENSYQETLRQKRQQLQKSKIIKVSETEQQIIEYFASLSKCNLTLKQNPMF